MLTRLIEQYICSNGIKIQKWKNDAGYDIAVIQNGIIQSTCLTNDKTEAKELFESLCFENETNKSCVNKYMNREKSITEYLLKRGLHPKHKGFSLIKMALTDALNKKYIIQDVIKVYEDLAKISKMNIYAVERNIRYSITTACYTKQVPKVSNNEFLAKACVDLL